MEDYDDFDEREGLSRAGLIRAALDIFGLLVICAALVGGAYALVRYGRAGELTAGVVLVTLASLLGGVTLGVTFLGISEIIRRLAAIQAANEQPSSRPEWTGGPVTRAGGSGGDESTAQALDELIVLMREVRDISLLSEEQRSLRLQAQGNAVLNLLQREVPVLLREHNWIEARNRVQEARERFPTFSEWDGLEQQIERMRAQVEARDIETAQRQIDDLASLGAWDRVAEVIKELLERHPDSARANQLAHNLRAERNKAEAEQRARLMAQAQEATNAREWKAALSAATALIQRFPRTPEAQALRMQLPTLQENAEIQIRQQMETEIRDLLKAQRFDEALRIAHELLGQYPDSPQAAVLRQQLPRLEQKATAMGSRT